MKFNFINRSVLIFQLFIFPAYGLFAQLMPGGIINLAGDTVACKIASSPKDADLKKQTGTYHYDYVVAVFNNDSAAFLYPGSIKGYYLNWNIGNTPKVNRYFSDSINLKFDMLFKKPPVIRPVFLQSLVTGGYYHLWYFEQPDPGARNDRFFILEESSTGKKNYLHSTGQLKKLLGEWPGSDKQDPGYKNWFTGKQQMVSDFNRYKSGK
jgi:hypothetical protein